MAAAIAALLVFFVRAVVCVKMLMFAWGDPKGFGSHIINFLKTKPLGSGRFRNFQKKTAQLGGFEFNICASLLPQSPNRIRVLNDNNKD
jgi:hypothetical protein